jgi:hypothetical protein
MIVVAVPVAIVPAVPAIRVVVATVIVAIRGG